MRQGMLLARFVDGPMSTIQTQLAIENGARLLHEMREFPDRLGAVVNERLCCIADPSTAPVVYERIAEPEGEAVTSGWRLRTARYRLAVVPFEGEAWGTPIEHEPEREQVVPRELVA